MNFYDELFYRLTEGKSTGGDMEATAERLGKWHKGIGFKAGPTNFPDTHTPKKPGEKGYMRPRNVPKPGEKYDPKRHSKPEKGKPLEYNPKQGGTAPDHQAYSKTGISSVIGKIASKEVGETEARPTQAQTDKFFKATKRGRAILRKYEPERERGKLSSF